MPTTEISAFMLLSLSLDSSLRSVRLTPNEVDDVHIKRREAILRYTEHPPHYKFRSIRSKCNDRSFGGAFM